MTSPDFMPILSRGAHDSPAKGACVMEMVSFLYAGADTDPDQWTDRPECTHPALARMAQRVNDRLPDARRGELLPLIPRLVGTASDDKRLSVELAIWCGEQTVHLAGTAEPKAREALCQARAWLAGTATQADCRSAASAAYAASAAAYAASAAAYAASASAAAYAYAAAYAAAGKRVDLVGLLTGLLDEYDRLTGRGPADELAEHQVQRLAALTNV